MQDKNKVWSIRMKSEKFRPCIANFATFSIKTDEIRYKTLLEAVETPSVTHSREKNAMDAFKKSKVKKWINIYNLVGMELNYI